MRSYPSNSPQAAARILALTLLSDGHLCTAELRQLHALDAAERLGLTPHELQAIVHAFCEDLLGTADHGWGAACHVDPGTLDAILAEVEDPRLRLTLLELCLSVVQADEHVADGESTVLAALVERWGLHHRMFVSGRTAERLMADA
jgi:uncharacterized tellurite resistance protein B-like protein